MQPTARFLHLVLVFDVERGLEFDIVVHSISDIFRVRPLVGFSQHGGQPVAVEAIRHGHSHEAGEEVQELVRFAAF